MSAMVVAASLGHVELLGKLVGGGDNPWDMTLYETSQTPFQVACHTGHLDAAKFLLATYKRSGMEKKKAANTQDENGNSCYHLAALAGHQEVLEGLYPAGVDLTLQNRKSGTPLHAAAAVGHVERSRGDGVGEGESGGDGRRCEGVETALARAKAEEMDDVV